MRATAFNTPCPPFQTPALCGGKATRAYSEPSRSVIFQFGGSNGWKNDKRTPATVLVREGVRHPSAHSAVPVLSPRPEGRLLNWNRVGSRPSTLKLTVEGGSIAPRW